MFYRYCRDFILLTMFRLKAEYNRSIVGSAWVAIRPLMNTLTFAIVMSKISGMEISKFFGFIAINLTTWGLIVNVFSGSCAVFNSKRAILINKLVDPNKITLSFISKYVYIYAISMFLPLLIGVVTGSIKFTLISFAFIPYFLVLIYCLFCISFSISCLYPFFEDISYIIEVFIPIAMWLTPIVYPIEKIPGILSYLQIVNPFYIMIYPFTSIFYMNQLPSFEMNISLACLAAISSLFYIFLYKKVYKQIAYRMFVSV